MKKLSILSLLATTALFCAVPVSLQLSQDSLSVSFDSARARVGNPLTPGSVAGVHRRVERRTARRSYYGGDGYSGYTGYGGYSGYGYGIAAAGVHRRVDRRIARRAYYGGYGYAMAPAEPAYSFAGGMYSDGSYNYYPTHAIYTQGYVPPDYYGPVCNPRVDRLCQ